MAIQSKIEEIVHFFLQPYLLPDKLLGTSVMLLQ